MPITKPALGCLTALGCLVCPRLALLALPFSYQRCGGWGPSRGLSMGASFHGPCLRRFAVRGSPIPANAAGKPSASVWPRTEAAVGSTVSCAPRATTAFGTIMQYPLCDFVSKLTRQLVHQGHSLLDFFCVSSSSFSVYHTV